MSRKFSKKSVEAIQMFTHEFSRQAGVLATDVSTLDPTAIIAVFDVITKFLPMLAQLCGKVPPPAPAVPAELMSQGVTQEAYTKAFQGNWGAKEAYNPKTGKYRTKAVNESAKELAKANGTKKRKEKQQAIAAFETARNKAVEDLALLAHEGND